MVAALLETHPALARRLQCRWHTAFKRFSSFDGRLIMPRQSRHGSPDFRRKEIIVIDRMHELGSVRRKQFREVFESPFALLFRRIPYLDLHDEAVLLQKLHHARNRLEFMRLDVDLDDEERVRHVDQTVYSYSTHGSRSSARRIDNPGCTSIVRVSLEQRECSITIRRRELHRPNAGFCGIEE